MAEPTPTPDLSDCGKSQQSVINLLAKLLQQLGVKQSEIDACIVK